MSLFNLDGDFDDGSRLKVEDAAQLDADPFVEVAPENLEEDPDLLRTTVGVNGEMQMIERGSDMIEAIYGFWGEAAAIGEMLKVHRERRVICRQQAVELNQRLPGLFSEEAGKGFALPAEFTDRQSLVGSRKVESYLVQEQKRAMESYMGGLGIYIQKHAPVVLERIQKLEKQGLEWLFPYPMMAEEISRILTSKALMVKTSEVTTGNVLDMEGDVLEANVDKVANEQLSTALAMYVTNITRRGSGEEEHYARNSFAQLVASNVTFQQLRDGYPESSAYFTLRVLFDRWVTDNHHQLANEAWEHMLNSQDMIRDLTTKYEAAEGKPELLNIVCELFNNNFKALFLADMAVQLLEDAQVLNEALYRVYEAALNVVD